MNADWLLGSDERLDLSRVGWDKSDAHAFETLGARFSPQRAAWAIGWIENNCVLYEGDRAGEPIKLLDWAYDCTARIFGWLVPDPVLRWKRRYRRAVVFVPKKNGKSPTLAAWACYLMAGDAEPGQHVYMAAKNRDQAKIATTHAIQMVKKGPLSKDCKINNSTSTITHLSSNSNLFPISSNNASNQRSKEGLNGSVCIDETHVVDKALVRILRGAGISRAEPLQLEVSTAGNDPEAYGREQFELAQKIISGDERDPYLFAAIYAAPQDLSEADLLADPIKWGKIANPAWGTLIKESEYLYDLEQARRTPQGMSDFMMYRLNVWQQSASTWLPLGAWRECAEDFDEEDLRGQECWAGLDLSRTRDMSACALAFPNGEGEDKTYRLLVHYWLPEDRADSLAADLDIHKWVEEGVLTTTPGNTVDYSYIYRWFFEQSQRYCIQRLCYDPTFADDITAKMSDGITGRDGVLLEPGTGVPRSPCIQVDRFMAAPTADFERAVLSRRVRHNGNSLLSWQVGNCKVKRSPKGFLRVAKEHPESARTIDGVVAALMAMGQAQVDCNYGCGSIVVG